MFLSYFALLTYLSAIPHWVWDHIPGLNVGPHPQLQTQTQNLSTLLTLHLSLIIQGNLTTETYAAIQPTQEERVAWSNATTMLLNVNGNCSIAAETIPDALRGIYTVLEVENGFCALVEVGTTLRGDHVEYKKGWGVFVVPSKTEMNAGSYSGLHLSAPHPVFDLYTAGQAARVFEKTGAKSLYIPGRSNQAFREVTDCVQPGSGSDGYWKTDAVHDDKEMMFETYKAILGWENGQTEGGGSRAYIQFHGKGKRTCRTDQVFLSAGLGRSPASLSWYTDPFHASLPIHKLLTQIKEHFPLWNATTPASLHSSCSLTATKNIIGRLINGVPQDKVCTQAATAENATGLFVHIEQDIDARKSENWETWAQVVSDAKAV
ncbi:hypothetical protein AX15_000739 [Amanita polypyramis BW_CC]|nr:hypothetical protein AX15_000739 [Amanita polypyramis BW_CC]